MVALAGLRRRVPRVIRCGRIVAECDRCEHRRDRERYARINVSASMVATAFAAGTGVLRAEFAAAQSIGAAAVDRRGVAQCRCHLLVTSPGRAAVAAAE